MEPQTYLICIYIYIYIYKDIYIYVYIYMYINTLSLACISTSKYLLQALEFFQGSALAAGPSTRAQIVCSIMVPILDPK